MTTFPVSLDIANRMTVAAFIQAFGDVAEHAPWVAAVAAEARPFASRQAMSDAFGKAVVRAGRERQIELLLAHPDLAGKAAIAGDLTQESKSEQASAGLDQLTPDEYDAFIALNQAYRDRHGFPFILAVRGATKHDILEGFEKRMDSPHDVEFRMALTQVARIIRFRIEDRVLL
jgi:2-oxo-4-hydroxy-4-carboxy-5-ureidoimidazoline decarboxylase